MSVDAVGYLWISNPAVATLTLALTIGLLLRCHRFVNADRPTEAVRVPVRTDDPVTLQRERSHGGHRRSV